MYHSLVLQLLSVLFVIKVSCRNLALFFLFIDFDNEKCKTKNTPFDGAIRKNNICMILLRITSCESLESFQKAL
jgi:hypothetical protein